MDHIPIGNGRRPAHGRSLPVRGAGLALACLLVCYVGAAEDGPAESCFREGLTLYEAGRYEEAIAQFERAAGIAPAESTYHHWLGKSYGRTAEKSNWLRALKFARRTRQELETAVRLDDRNIDALSDLLMYYRRAPAFLGGSERRARAIEQRLAELTAPNTAAEVSGPGDAPL